MNLISCLYLHVSVPVRSYQQMNPHFGSRLGIVVFQLSCGLMLVSQSYHGQQRTDQQVTLTVSSASAYVKLSLPPFPCYIICH